MPVEPDSITAYVPKTKDEKRFYDKHIVQKTADRNGNGDDVFTGSNVKTHDRAGSRHGYMPKEDQKVYESRTLTQILGEKTLTKPEMKKREEVAKAIERENPGMPMAKKMAIATATAKRVAEETQPGLFDAFAEELRPQLEDLFNMLTDDNKQVMIEMIEAEDYDSVVEVLKEVQDGSR